MESLGVACPKAATLHRLVPFLIVASGKKAIRRKTNPNQPLRLMLFKGA